MTSKVCLAAFLGMACVLLSVRVNADEFDDLQNGSLKGLDEIFVTVSPIEKDVEENGLTADLLRQDVELRLRKAGIRILSEKDFKSNPLTPVLDIRAHFGRQKGTREGLYAYHLYLALSQIVSLSRDPKITTFTSTWDSKYKLGVVEKSNVRKIREPVADLADEFINAFLAANPKK